MGCLPICYIYSSGAGPTADKPFYGLDAKAPTVLLDLNPLNVFPYNTPEYNNCLNYTRFKFTKARLIYSESVNTAVVGSVLIGYYPDGALSTADVNDSLILRQPGTMQSQIWNPVAFTDVSKFLDQSSWFYMALGVADVPSYRQTFQGGIMGTWFYQPTLVDSYVGFLYLDYEVQIIDPKSIIAPLALVGPTDQQDHKRSIKDEQLLAKGILKESSDGKDRDDKSKTAFPQIIYTEIGPSGKKTIYQEAKLETVGEIKESVPVTVTNEVKADITGSIPLEVNADIKASVPIDVGVTASVPLTVGVASSIPLIISSIDSEVDVNVPSTIDAFVTNDVLNGIPIRNDVSNVLNCFAVNQPDQPLYVACGQDIDLSVKIARPGTDVKDPLYFACSNAMGESSEVIGVPSNPFVIQTGTVGACDVYIAGSLVDVPVEIKDQPIDVSIVPESLVLEPEVKVELADVASLREPVARPKSRRTGPRRKSSADLSVKPKGPTPPPPPSV
jgi:hypothetical protein